MYPAISDAKNLLIEKIMQADAIVIGGGSGLSSAAGYDHYHWSPALRKSLDVFREYYGFRSPLDGFYHCFSSYEEQWGYYSQYIRFMWDAPPGQTYLDLKEIIGQKPCFILTTNVDMQFFKVFPREQICAFQGDFQYCQCSQPCEDVLYDSRKMVEVMSNQLIDGVKIKTDMVPRCGKCGRVMVPWVRDDSFLEGKYWADQAEHYHRFLRYWITEQEDSQVLLLELGVGEMTPSVIKLPFWEMTEKNKNVFYACLNKKPSHAPKHLRGKSLYLEGDLKEMLGSLKEAVKQYR